MKAVAVVLILTSAFLLNQPVSAPPKIVQALPKKAIANQIQVQQFQAQQPFSCPIWAVGTLPKDNPQSVSVVQIVLDPYTGWAIRVLCRDVTDPNDGLYPANLLHPPQMAPRTFQYLSGLSFLTNAQAKAWVIANIPPVAPYTQWIWDNQNQTGRMAR